jgi:hypothetical protein
MTVGEAPPCSVKNPDVSDVVCPACWSWSPIGQRSTCKKCGVRLLHANGRPVADLVAPQEPAAPGVAAGPREMHGAPAAPSQPAEAAASRRPHGFLRAIAGAGVALLVAGTFTGAILGLRFLHGSADSMVGKAPSDSIAYVNINLDPSAAQKLAIASLLNKFPGLSGSSRDGTVNSWIDSALTGSGLNHNDVRPWLGSQISLVALPGSGSTGGSPVDVVSLLASDNDTSAQAMFDKLRSSPRGSGLQWTVSTYDGVTISSSTGPQTLVYAINRGTVLIGNDLSGVHDVLDTTTGKHASIESTSDYTTVQSQLPRDRVASLFVDMPAITNALKATSGAPSAASAPALTGFDAYRGIGAVVVVSSTGVSVDAVQDYDSSQLTSDQRAVLGAPSHLNGSLALMPSSVYGFLTVAGLPAGLRTLLDPSSATAAAIRPALDQLGITGSSGIIDHLSGDAGFEVDSLPGTKTPAGGVLFEVDSASAARTFLSSLPGKVCALTGGACSPGEQTTQAYRGADITSVSVSGAGVSGVTVSFAVSGNWAMIATSADEVKAMLDAQRGGGIAASSTFSAVGAQTGTSNASMFYLDIHAVVSAVRGVLPPDAAATFDQNVAPYLSPFQALGVSSQNAGDHTSSTMFLLIS